MNLIKQYFEQHDSELRKSLMTAEFTNDQAQLFLHETEKSLIDSSLRSNVFLTIACLFSASPYELPRNIDAYSIAKNSGMNLVQTTAGFRAIAPVLLHAMSVKNPLTDHKEARPLKIV